MAPLFVVAALIAGCGSSSDAGSPIQPVAADGEPPAQAREGAEAAANEFIDSLAGRNAEAFCAVALPEIQRPNFNDANAPAGDCEERAEAMFGVHSENGAEPAWETLSQGRVTGVKLECAPAAERCSRATVTIAEVPLRDGGTTTAPTPVSFAGGRWRVGHYWVEVEGEGEPPAHARRDPVAAAQGFLDSLTEQDPAAFCELTLPAAQRAAFASNGAPAGGDCEQRARAMFRAPVQEGSEPLWAREAQAVLGEVNLHCAGQCRSARIRIESLPLAGGGTTIAPMTIKQVGGRWLVGAVEPAPLGGDAEGGNQT